MLLWLCVLCAVVCQRRSYSTFLTLTVWLLTARDPLLLDSGEEEREERGQGCQLLAQDKPPDTERGVVGGICVVGPRVSSLRAKLS